MAEDDDIRHVDDAELAAWQHRISTERARRHTMKDAGTRAAKANRDYLTASGVKDGDQWKQPTSAVDAYPKDWTVTHDGKAWTSTVANNVWEPPTNWREQTDNGSVPEWIEPTNAEDGYAQGERVTYDGDIYESTYEGINVWSPEEYPDGWKQIDPTTEGES